MWEFSNLGYLFRGPHYNILGFISGFLPLFAETTCSVRAFLKVVVLRLCGDQLQPHDCKDSEESQPGYKTEASSYARLRTEI